MSDPLTTRQEFIDAFHAEKMEDLVNVIFDGTPDTTAIRTGVLTGGEVTINADNTKFDIAAGTGQIIDWTNPAAPKRTKISWPEMLAETIPSLAAIFTTVAFDANGLVKLSGVLVSDADLKSRVNLQTVIHQNGTSINDISLSGNPAYNVQDELLAFVRALGPANKGNKFSANGTNLKINRSAGTLVLPFINYGTDRDTPSTVQTTAATAFTFNRIYRDGSGGFTLENAVDEAEPDLYDDGSGTLQAVSNNNWTYQMIYLFGAFQPPLVTIVYGQETFSSYDDAFAAAQSPDIEEFDVLGGAIQRSTLVIKKGTADLTLSDNTFINYRT